MRRLLSAALGLALLAGAAVLFAASDRGLALRHALQMRLERYAAVPFALAGLGGTGPEMLEIFRSLGLSAFDIGTGFGGIKPLRPIGEVQLIKRYPPDREVFTNLMLFRRRPSLAPAAESG